MAYNREKMEESVKLFLEAVGHPDWENDENTKETPTRVSKMYEIMLGGYDIDNKQYVKTFPAKSQDLVVVSPIKFLSYCSHHVVPFFGVISIGYIPNKAVVGLSKLARIARTHCKRLQLQEALVTDIADDIERLLDPLGVAVRIRAKHQCTEWRGVRTPGAIMTVATVRGILKEDASARSEFLDAVKDTDHINF